MPLARLAFGVALAGFVVFPASWAATGAALLIAIVLLPPLGYRDGTWRGLRWALVVPAAAFAADVITFTPLSLQSDTDATIYTPIALFYLPAWALLAGSGIVARRLRHHRRPSVGPI